MPETKRYDRLGSLSVVASLAAFGLSGIVRVAARHRQARHRASCAASLLKQHLNFLKQHSENDFTRRYMADIGHYEFGALHRPIRFPGLEDLLEGRDERTLDYWLAYWVAAFEHVRTRRDKVRIVPYEALCGDGPTVFRELCGQLGVGDAQAVARAGEIFRRGTDHAVSTDEVDEDLRMSSQALYADLGGDLGV